MLRKLLVAVLVVAFAAAALAQQTIAPLTGGGADAISKNHQNADRAWVEQTVTLNIPKATALHLDVTAITFDLEALNGDDWEARARGDMDLPSDYTLACVYANGPDVTRNLGNEYWNQVQTLPGGTQYTTATYPNIRVAGERVVTYPPIRIGEDGELVTGSKNHIVCYQSFIIQLFSNFENWEFSVRREDADPDNGIEHLYVQGNTCADYGAETGLYALNNGDTINLIPRRLSVGTTGDEALKAGSNCNQASSWLDIVGVLAVKVNSDSHGESVANLAYSLISYDPPTAN